MAKKGYFQSCGTNAKNRERARQVHFACSSSRSESMIRFILPASGFSHIIIENNKTFSTLVSTGPASLSVDAFAP